MFGTTRWSPFDELTSLHREMDRLFSRTFGESQAPADSTFAPALEVTSGKDGWHVRVALPGIDPKDVQIDLAGDTLTIRGERTHTGQKGDKNNAHVTEIAYGRFERTLTLPDAIDQDKVTATYNNGMLELALPLRESVKPRRIEVKGAGEAKALAAA
jgi:HSP20 family protein